MVGRIDRFSRPGITSGQTAILLKGSNAVIVVVSSRGGTASLPIFGYRKKPGAQSDADWERLPEVETVYREWFDRLDRGATYAEVADWLNNKGIDTGPLCPQ